MGRVRVCYVNTNGASLIPFLLSEHAHSLNFLPMVSDQVDMPTSSNLYLAQQQEQPHRNVVQIHPLPHFSSSNITAVFLLLCYNTGGLGMRLVYVEQKHHLMSDTGHLQSLLRTFNPSNLYDKQFPYLSSRRIHR